MKKGQTVELLSFLLLVVVVVIVFLTINYLTAGKKVDVMELTQESQDISYFNAGATTFSAITEPATNKTFVELMGLAGFFEKSVLEFGPTDSPTQVNVFDEATKRLDLIYGKGHWHMDVHHAPPYEMYVIILIDVSKSMEQEIKNINGSIGHIITTVKKNTGKRVFYKLYFLPGNNAYMSMFNDAVKEFPNLKTYIVDQVECSITGDSKNEEWAKGMKCLIDKKSGEWGDVTAKVGIILSDEPPGGCEGCDCREAMVEACCANIPACEDHNPAKCAVKDNDITALKNTANGLTPTPMNIYTLKADPCTKPSGVPCMLSDDGQTYIPYTCAGNPKLIEYMTRISTYTGGQMYEVDYQDVSKAIEEIVVAHSIPDIPSELGTTPPEGKVIHSFVIPAPTPVPGAYVKVVLKQWN